MSQPSILRLINDLYMRFNNVDSDSGDCNDKKTKDELKEDTNEPQQREGTKFCDDAELNRNNDTKRQDVSEIFDYDIWEFQSEVFKSFDVCRS